MGFRVHRSTGYRLSGLVRSGRRQGVASATMRRPRLSTWRLIRFRHGIFHELSNENGARLPLANRTPPSVDATASMHLWVKTYT